MPEFDPTTEIVDLLSDKSLTHVAPELLSDPPTKASLYRLRDLQKEHDIVFADYLREKQLLEQRFEKKFSPLYTRREEELKDSPIDDFWFRSFVNCQLLYENITERDSVLLEFLTDVSCENITTIADPDQLTKPFTDAELNATDGEQSADVSWTDTINDSASVDQSATNLPMGSFILSFRFRDNPFFENDLLTKTYIMHADDYEELAEARGCNILWKKGMDVTTRILKKKSKNGRVLVKKQPTDSFFNFFSPPQGFPASETDADSTIADELEDVMEADFELGDCIRSEVIPKALLFFLDIVERSDEDDLDSGDEADDDNDDDDDDDDDDDNDEEDSDDDESDAKNVKRTNMTRAGKGTSFKRKGVGNGVNFGNGMSGAPKGHVLGEAETECKQQ